MTVVKPIVPANHGETPDIPHPAIYYRRDHKIASFESDVTALIERANQLFAPGRVYDVRYVQHGKIPFCVVALAYDSLQTEPLFHRVLWGSLLAQPNVKGHPNVWLVGRFQTPPKQQTQESAPEIESVSESELAPSATKASA